MSAPMMAFMRWIVAVAVCVNAAAVSASDLTNLPADGWVAWDVPTVDAAPAWCCFHGSSAGAGTTDATPCNLDDQQHGFGTRHRETAASLRIYVRLAGGKVERLRGLDSGCATKTASPVKLWPQVSVAASVEWLGRLIERTPSTTGRRERNLENDALAAIAAHRGNEARALMASLASAGGNRPIETRKNAMFWLTQARGQEGIDIVAPYLFDDADSKLRAHAAFCVSQTRLPGATVALIKQGEHDRDAEVRSKAWFWLAQSKAPQAEAAIAKAVRQDTERRVRREAIFALSQLPAGRAVPALRNVAEDRALGIEERKQAVFWISHNGGDDATAYLDQVLSKTAHHQ